MQASGDIGQLLEHLEPSEFESVARQVRAIEQRRWRDGLPPPASLPWLSTALYAALALGVFLFCTWSKPSFRFDGDDLMNLHESYVVKPLVLLRALALPVTTFNRPTGALYYRLCFDIFGWNPAAFRVVTYLIMIANLGLTWLLARRLTGSMEMGGAAALLYCFHARLRPVYSSNGTVYDVICAFFLLLMLCYYIRIRQEGLRWTWWRVGAVLALYILALNGKEMAAIAPAVLLIFELLYYPPREIMRNGWIALVLALLTGFALWGKTRTGGPFHGESMYVASFTLKRFFQNARGLHSQLLYLPENALSTRQVLTLWTSLFILPVWTSATYRRALWFSATFAVLGPLPVAFLPMRWFYVMYVPLIGWSIYLAILLVMARDGIVREVRRRSPMSARGWMVARAALALLIAFAVTRGLYESDFNAPRVDPMRAFIDGTKNDFLALREPLPRGSRTLLLHSRFPDDAWGPLMIARLLYRDPDLWLDRPTVRYSHGPLDAAALAAYDRVFDFDGQRMLVVQRRAGAAVLLPH